jgi:hypothetical protein
VADVLIKIFLFLPIEHLTLVGVSAVSRAWRAAAAHLPQWAVVPALWGMNSALIAAATSLFIDPTAMAMVDGVGVTNRAEYMDTMRRRWQLKQSLIEATKAKLARHSTSQAAGLADAGGECPCICHLGDPMLGGGFVQSISHDP